MNKYQVITTSDNRYFVLADFFLHYDSSPLFLFFYTGEREGKKENVAVVNLDHVVSVYLDDKGDS